MGQSPAADIDPGRLSVGNLPRPDIDPRALRIDRLSLPPAQIEPLRIDRLRMNSIDPGPAVVPYSLPNFVPIERLNIAPLAEPVFDPGRLTLSSIDPGELEANRARVDNPILNPIDPGRLIVNEPQFGKIDPGPLPARGFRGGPAPRSPIFLGAPNAIRPPSPRGGGTSKSSLLNRPLDW